MGKKAVGSFGKAGGAGAVGSEGDGDDMPGDNGVPAGDKVVLVGGPGEGADAGLKFAPIIWGDKTFNTQEELTAHLDSLSTEIKTLKEKPLPAATQPVAAAPKAPAQATLAAPIADPAAPAKRTADEALAEFFADPAGYETKLEQRILNKAAAAQAAAKNMDNFWGGFWSDNKELKQDKHESFVNGILAANRATLDPLSMTDARAKLGELVRDAIISVGGARPKSNEGRAMVEGGGSPAPKAPAKDADSGKAPAGSLSAAIKKRQADRRKLAEAGKAVH